MGQGEEKGNMPMYALERKEHYIAKTELLKNRTHQSYRWKQVALCEDKSALIKMMGREQRVINWDNLEVIVES